jgi:hypothetical protein
MASGVCRLEGCRDAKGSFIIGLSSRQIPRLAKFAVGARDRDGAIRDAWIVSIHRYGRIVVKRYDVNSGGAFHRMVVDVAGYQRLYLGTSQIGMLLECQKLTARPREWV